MASIVLKVKPDELKKKSTEISNKISSIETDFGKIEQLVLGTRQYWEGDASTQHIKNYNKIKDDIKKIVKRLKEHPTDLEEMAGIYEQTEMAAKQLASMLPTDVL